jgi:hypothetical protein
MEIHHLVLIEDDIDAQRLIVTWPQVAELYESDAEAGRERWAVISNVYVDDVERLEHILFSTNILGPAGFQDDTALKFIRGRIAGKLPKVPK